MSQSARARAIRIPRLKRTALLVLAATAIAMLTATTAPGSARLVWNTSPSAPAGIYYIESDGWRVGDRIAARPSANLARDLDGRRILPLGRLLIKRVVAGEGDVVCRQGNAVTVNSTAVATALSVSRAGAALPVWSGCQTFGASDVLLLGETPHSYDGRYFGVTRAEEIVGRVRLLVAF